MITNTKFLYIVITLNNDIDAIIKKSCTFKKYLKEQEIYYSSHQCRTLQIFIIHNLQFIL